MTYLYNKTSGVLDYNLKALICDQGYFPFEHEPYHTHSD